MAPVGPLLAELRGTGLLTHETAAEGPATYAFHELVRERMARWWTMHQDELEGRTDDEIRLGYGERYANLFDDLYTENRNAAGEAGRRALVYFVAARAFERLGSFASTLVTGVNDPTLLRSVVAELEGAIDQAPAGQSRWSLRTFVADALWKGGQPDRALAFFPEAAAEAEAAEHWSHVAWITENWANACVMTGDLEQAKGLRLRSAEAHQRAGDPEVNMVGCELEALRIDVWRGEAETTLPAIEARLERVRDWWQRTLSGEAVAEAPDRTVLGRTLVSGLDIAKDANRSLERWQACLDLLKEIESVEGAQGENEVELAGTRFNQYGALLRLGRVDAAQRIVESCLTVFRSAGVVADEARCLSALAQIWDERGEIFEAIALERQALAVSNTLPDPSDRAISHDSLSTYHDKAGQPTESTPHRLAAGVYWLVTGQRDYLTTWLSNVGICARRALAAGERYTLPRLDALLAREDFATLRQFLDSHQVDRAALQAELDRLVEEAHEQPTDAVDSPVGKLPPALARLLEPVFAAAAAGEDIEPLLAGLREPLAELGADDGQIDGFLEMVRGELKSPE